MKSIFLKTTAIFILALNLLLSSCQGKITKETVVDQLEHWGDSTLIYISLSNGDRFMFFQILSDSTYSSDKKTINQLEIIENQETGVQILFHDPKSAIIGVPSISGIQVFEINSHHIKGIENHISPPIDSSFPPDTFIIMTATMDNILNKSSY